MEVKSSKNPIIINGKDISNPSWYLSANGGDFDEYDFRDMGNGENQARLSQTPSVDEFYDADGDNYSYIDRKNTAEVKAFQDWLDAKGLGWVGATNAQRSNGKPLFKGAGYGNFGKSTSNAYAVYGAEWEASRQQAPAAQPPAPSTQMQVVTSGVPTVEKGQQPTPAQITEQKKKGVFWDKAKGVWVKAKESGVLDFLSDVFGLTPRTDMGGGMSTGEAEPQRKKNTGLYIGIGVLVIVGVILATRNRK